MLEMVVSGLAAAAMAGLLLAASNSHLHCEGRVLRPLLNSAILFAVLLSSMPECSFKITTLLTSRDAKQRLDDEDRTFPVGLFIVVVSFVFSAVFDKVIASDPN